MKLKDQELIDAFNAAGWMTRGAPIRGMMIDTDTYEIPPVDRYIDLKRNRLNERGVEVAERGLLFFWSWGVNAIETIDPSISVDASTCMLVKNTSESLKLVEFFFPKGVITPETRIAIEAIDMLRELRDNEGNVDKILSVSTKRLGGQPAGTFRRFKNSVKPYDEDVKGFRLGLPFRTISDVFDGRPIVNQEGYIIAQATDFYVIGVTRVTESSLFQVTYRTGIREIVDSK